MGMARMNRQGGGKLQGARVQRRPIAQGGASEREGAGLVEDDGIDLGQTLQAAAILQQDIAFEEPPGDRKSTRLNSSHVKSSYAVFCLKKKKTMLDDIPR